MIIRELITVLGFDVDDAPLDRVDEGLDRIKSSIKRVATLGAIAGGTLFGLAKSTANTADAAAKTGRAIGLTAEEVQEYNHAASIAGLSNEEMQKSLRQMGRAARDATRGIGTAKDTIEEMGISVTDANGQLKSTDVLVEEVADQFAAMPDGPRKTAAAMDLFGRSGDKFINLLNQGGDGIRELRQEARDLGVIIDNETAAKAELFNDTLFRLQQLLTGIKHTAGAEIIPILIEEGKRTLEWAKANKELMKARVREFVQGLIKVFKSILTLTLWIGEAVSKLGKAMGGLEKVIWLVTSAMLAFVASQFINALWGAGQVVFGLIQHFRQLGTAALFAQAKMLAIPLLVGAAIASIIVIVQDLIGWMEGKDSRFGRIFGLGNAEENIKMVKSWLVAILGIIAGIALLVSGPVLAAVALVAAMVGLLVTHWDRVKLAFINAGQQIKAFFKHLIGWMLLSIIQLGLSIGQKLGEWFFPLIDAWNDAEAKIKKGFRDMVDTLKGWAKELFGTFGKIADGADRVLNFVGIGDDEGVRPPSGPQMAGAFVGGGAAGPAVDARKRVRQVQNSKSNQISVGSVSVPIQGNPDMSPAELEGATESGVLAALERVMQDASEAFDGGEEVPGG